MRRARLLPFLIVLVTCIGCDHATKQAAGLLLAGSNGLGLAGDVVRLELVSNPGAFMSLGAHLAEPLRHVLLLGVVPVLLALVCAYFFRTALTSRVELVALGLVAGGGLGNWLDRVLHEGTVTDFVSVGLGRFRTGIFNLADVAVVTGMLLLISFARSRASVAGRHGFTLPTDR